MLQGMKMFHTWGGLCLGWVLFIVFFTGTIAVFEPEISAWMRPEVRVQQRAATAVAVAAAEKALRQLASDADVWFVALPQGRISNVEVSWKKGKQDFHQFIDPSTGAVIKARDTEGGEFFALFHYELSRGHTGTWLVSIAGLAMLAALISGIVIRRSVIKDFFFLRWRRSWLSVHTMTGILTLPFVVMITYSGLVMTFMDIMPVSMHTFYSGQNKFWVDLLQVVERPMSREKVQTHALADLVPAAERELGDGNIWCIQVPNPDSRSTVINFMRRVDDRLLAIADRVTFDGVSGEWLVSQTKWGTQATLVRSLVGLHIVKFGGYPMAWLYFILGMISSIMIGTGLVFFTIKRRARYAKEWGTERDLFRVAESLNIGVIAGLITASLGFLWVNRLLPVALKGRAEAEIGAFFFCWLCLFIHAFLQPKEKAWSQQLYLAAGLALGLPLVNALMTSVGLSKTIVSGDWVTAGVDITVFVFGLLLWTVAKSLEKHWTIFQLEDRPKYKTGFR